MTSVSRWRRAGTLVATAATFSSLGVGFAAAPASALQACDGWTTTLKPGSTGSQVKELQIRVAGWVSSGQVMGTDGSYGPQTTTAVANFQRAYGLSATGTADAKTFSKIRSLTSPDCTPLHFTYTEVSANCGKGFTGSGAQKANLRRAMWQAEALRHQLGDVPLRVTSGFRDPSCNASVGGSSNSRHMTGQALDLVPEQSPTTICDIARKGRTSGWGTVLGPGFDGHDDHTHVDFHTTVFWSAKNCFTAATAQKTPPNHVPDV